MVTVNVNSPAETLEEKADELRIRKPSTQKGSKRVRVDQPLHKNRHKEPHPKETYYEEDAD